VSYQNWLRSTPTNRLHSTTHKRKENDYHEFQNDLYGSIDSLANRRLGKRANRHY
jgi:hypothetical protein